MLNPKANSKQNLKPGQESNASYFGVVVEVIERMENCSLIRCRNRQFVVSTEDLRFRMAMEQVA